MISLSIIDFLDGLYYPYVVSAVSLRSGEFGQRRTEQEELEQEQRKKERKKESRKDNWRWRRRRRKKEKKQTQINILIPRLKCIPF